MHATLAMSRVQAVRALAEYALPRYPCASRRGSITASAAHSIVHVRHRSADGAIVSALIRSARLPPLARLHGTQTCMPAERA